MLFNSAEFALFLPCVLAAFFATPARWRWLILLAASYFFYGSWNVYYLTLILATTGVTYVASRAIAAAPNLGRRRGWLIGAVVVNLGILFAFKYFNFFSASFAAGCGLFGGDNRPLLLHVALPVGISFYTFQALGHAVDVYRGDAEPEKRFGIFALFVAFFPQLVAGPIERSSRLLPQLKKAVTFDYRQASDGLKLIAWGLFKKVVIADRLEVYVNGVYGDASGAGGAQLLIATYFFAFQILCDFSGYTDIAIGVAQMFGVKLTQNFHRPYFAQSTPEFWRRWHVTLSTWFRDYLYIPLGGNRVSRSRWLFNIVIVFLLSGLWHGANWTFAAWGLWHGAAVAVSVLTLARREKVATALGLSRLPRWSAAWRMVFTFHWVVFGWVLFRASSIGEGWLIFRKIFAGEWTGSVTAGVVGRFDFLLAVALIAALLVIEAVRSRVRLRQWVAAQSWWLRWAIYFCGATAILLLGVFEKVEFIYFQF